MKPLETLPRRDILLAACLLAGGLGVLPPVDQRVDFAKHGGDWTQGNCGSRDFQSPLNLNELFKPASGDFMYFYKEVQGVNLTLQNDGRCMSIDVTGMGFGSVSLPAALGGGPAVQYNLIRIDLHAESEHTLRGEHSPLEIQLVHQASNLLDPTAGQQLVIISVLVDCPSPPTAKPVWPGLLQQDRAPPSSGASAEPLLRKSQSGSSRSLLQADAPSASPAAGPAAAMPYVIPPMGAPGFNSNLQFLVDQEPPVLDDEVSLSLPPMRPLRLASFVASGTYFTYKGSETLPPCDERVVWLIRREKVLASDAQVAALFQQMYLTSNGAGFYRTIMPVNRREIGVVSARESQPSSPALAAGQVAGFGAAIPGAPQAPPNPAVQMAQDSIIIAKATADYAKDLDLRLRAGADAHLRALLEPSRTTMAPPIGGTTTAPEVVPDAPLDQAWATAKIAGVVKIAIEDEVKAAIKDVAPAAASLAKSYLRRDLLTRAGFRAPPPTAAHAAAAAFLPTSAPAPLR